MGDKLGLIMNRMMYAFKVTEFSLITRVDLLILIVLQLRSVDKESIPSGLLQN